MKVLVCGGAGYIGSHACVALAARAKAQNCFDEHIIVRATMAVYAEILDTSTQSTLKSDRLD